MLPLNLVHYILLKDEEVGGELWRPRRRAISCSSSPYSSRSLMGLLSATRPASFVETYSSRSPANPSTSVAYRPKPNEHVLSGPISLLATQIHIRLQFVLAKIVHFSAEVQEVNTHCLVLWNASVLRN